MVGQSQWYVLLPEPLHRAFHVCSFCTLCPQGGSVAYLPSFDSTLLSLPCPLRAPVSPLVNLIFTPPLSCRCCRAAHFALLVEVVVIIKQKQRRKHDWLIVVSSPPCPRPTTRTRRCPPGPCCGDALSPQLIIERIGLLGGSSSTNSTQRRGTKGHMWGARGVVAAAAACIHDDDGLTSRFDCSNSHLNGCLVDW